MYPIFAIVGCLTMYLHSRFLIYRLMNQKRQPVAASNDESTAALMYTYMTLNFLIVFVFNSIILFRQTPRAKFFNLNI